MPAAGRGRVSRGGRAGHQLGAPRPHVRWSCTSAATRRPSSWRCTTGVRPTTPRGGTRRGRVARSPAARATGSRSCGASRSGTAGSSTPPAARSCGRRSPCRARRAAPPSAADTIDLRDSARTRVVAEASEPKATVRRTVLVNGARRRGDNVPGGVAARAAAGLGLRRPGVGRPHPAAHTAAPGAAAGPLAGTPGDAARGARGPRERPSGAVPPRPGRLHGAAGSHRRPPEHRARPRPAPACVPRRRRTRRRQRGADGRWPRAVPQVRRTAVSDRTRRRGRPLRGSRCRWTSFTSSRAVASSTALASTVPRDCIAARMSLASVARPETAARVRRQRGDLRVGPALGRLRHLGADGSDEGVGRRGRSRTATGSAVSGAGVAAAAGVVGTTGAGSSGVGVGRPAAQRPRATARLPAYSPGRPDLRGGVARPRSRRPRTRRHREADADVLPCRASRVSPGSTSPGLQRRRRIGGYGRSRRMVYISAAWPDRSRPLTGGPSGRQPPCLPLRQELHHVLAAGGEGGETVLDVGHSRPPLSVPSSSAGTPSDLKPW